MRITASVDTSALQATLADGQSALAGDLRRGMEAAAAAVQADLRGRTRAAGLGQGLEKSWQKRVYPPRAGGKALNPAALIYSDAKVLFTVFSEGATIVPRKGRFLAIPTKEAEAMGFAITHTNRAGKGTGSIPRRLSMVTLAIERLGKQHIRFAPSKRGRMVVIYSPQRGKNIPLFVLVPQVRLKAVLDIAAVRATANATLASEIRTALGG